MKRNFALARIEKKNNNKKIITHTYNLSSTNNASVTKTSQIFLQLVTW